MGGIFRRRLHGRFKPDDAPLIYAATDVVVNPRRRSTLSDKVTPLKPLEAMAWRKPVIVSSVQGMLELVRDGETGFVFEADNQTALREALLRATQDATATQEIARTGREFVAQQRSWRANGDRYKSIYTRLLADKPTSLAPPVYARR